MSSPSISSIRPIAAVVATRGAANVILRNLTDAVGGRKEDLMSVRWLAYDSIPYSLGRLAGSTPALSFSYFRQSHCQRSSP